MSRFAFIDLAQVPPPDIIETLSFPALKSAILSDATARMNAAGVAYDVAMLESDPFVALCEAYAFRELLLRQRINDAAKALLLASSWGTNLDGLAALVDTPRQPGELDAAYQARIQLAIQAFSSAGPAGAYEYFAREQLPGLQDVSVVMTAPGQVQVTLLYPPPQLTPTPTHIQALAAWLVQNDAKPLTDVVSVAAAKIVPVTITATLTLYPGPSAATVLAAANAALANVLSANQRLGYTLARSAIIAALQQPGVETVNLVSPAADVSVDDLSAWNVISTSISINPATST